MLFSPQAIQRAYQFLQTCGRPLDQARFQFHFGGGDQATVLAELARFQNPDGGFGHALEPDLRCPQSSPLATSHAFQVLREIGAGPGDAGAAALARPAIAYLLHSFDRDGLSWHNVPPGADGFPHAPWWTQKSLEDNLGKFELNPTAELLGCLVEYAPQADQSLVEALEEKIMALLAGLEKIMMHDFLCCKRLAETPGLEAALFERLFNELTRRLPGVVCTEPEKWIWYNLRPLWVAGAPDSPFYPLLKEEVEKNLDYEIAAQQEDGAWPVNWSWEGTFPEAWERSRLDWQGAFIIDRLVWFKRFGRLHPAG